MSTWIRQLNHFRQFQMGLSICAVSLLSLGLASCDKGSAPASGTGSSAAPVAGIAAPVPVKKIKIGVSIPSADHGWTGGVNWWASRTMALYPDVEWVYQTAANPDEQVKQVENMLGQDVDGLVILATESAPLTPVAKKAHERGVYIVNVDRGFLEPVADVFLEGDNKAFGRKSAEFIAQKMGGKGNLVILEGIPCTVNTDRVDAAKEVFKRFPDIKILGDQPANWNRQKGYEVMQNFLTQFPKIDAVWAQDDDTLVGALKAIKEAGRDKDIWSVGGAGMNQIVKMVAAGSTQVPVDVSYNPNMVATAIDLTALHFAAGAQVDGKMIINSTLITKDNAAQFDYANTPF